MKLKHITIIAIAVLPLFCSCAKLKAAFNSHKKLTKGTNYAEQYQKGLYYYNKKDYSRAQALFENVQNAYAGKDQLDTIMFYLADCHFKRRSYYISSELFDQYRITFGRSSFARQADFMYALSIYMIAPDAELDQTSTRSAITAFEDFMYRNPDDEKVPQAKKYIEEAYKRLYKNELDVAKTYFDIGYYNSAIVALNNVLKRVPDIPYREEILFLIVQSNYEYARSSIPSKQRDRFFNTIDAYYNFVSEYPNSPLLKSAKRFHLDATNVTSGKAVVSDVTGNVVNVSNSIYNKRDKLQEKVIQAQIAGKTGKKIEKMQIELDVMNKAIEKMEQLQRNREKGMIK